MPTHGSHTISHEHLISVRLRPIIFNLQLLEIKYGDFYICINTDGNIPLAGTPEACQCQGSLSVTKINLTSGLIRGMT